MQRTPTNLTLTLTFKVLLIIDSVFLRWAASCGTKDLLKTLNIEGLVQVFLFFITMATWWRRRGPRLEERRGVMKYVIINTLDLNYFNQYRYPKQLLRPPCSF